MLFVLTALFLWAQTTSLITIPEITGDGSVHAVSVTDNARFVQFVVPSTNASTARIGDSNTSSTRGVPMAPGSGFATPVLPIGSYYTLTNFYYYVANGDKLDIVYSH